MLRQGLLSAAVMATCAWGFQIQSVVHRSTRMDTSSAATISLDEGVERNLAGFAQWAADNGIQQDNGFGLTNSNGDWSAIAAGPGGQGGKVLHVPSHTIISSSRTMGEMPQAAQVMAVLESKGFQHLAPQFFLWLKILQEYERGQESPWYPWMESLPRRFDTAVSLDPFEVECLPPFIKSLCQIERVQLVVFRDILETLDVISQATKENGQLCVWAYNIVFTRCWGGEGSEHQIVPMADMFNHGYPANVAITYDGAGNCEVVLKQDVAPGTPLHLSYGMPTNPSRFLATFGFLDESPPATYCKIMALNPSQELINVGYDTSRMVFYTADGAIAEEVWDVVLYQLLDSYPDDQSAFYQAHMNGDKDTKVAIHGHYFAETCNMLKTHVDTTLENLGTLAEQMAAANPAEHPRLPLIQRHNNMVLDTFTKVKARLDPMYAEAVERRG